jgi:hypothetical protein
MSAPAGERGMRALRLNGRMKRRLVLSWVLWSVLIPLLSWLAVVGTSFPIGVVITIMALAVLGTQLYGYLRVRGLRLVGTRLVRGRKSCDLTTSRGIYLESKERKSRQYLILHLDDLRILLGSTAFPSNFEPEDLRRLAGLLSRSTHPGPREIAEDLNRLADDGRLEWWPAPR